MLESCRHDPREYCLLETAGDRWNPRNLPDRGSPRSAQTNPHLDSVILQGGGIDLQWSGGRATYQLQMSSKPDGPWSDVGGPTTNSSATVAGTNETAFFRVLSDATALYKVVFDATWSSTTHPGAFPGGAHWSGPIGGVHDDQVYFWRQGEVASEGIRSMAELGAQSTLANEVQAAISLGQADFVISGSGLGSPATSEITFPQPMRRAYPLVTLCTMIAPSPDWFVGAESVSLLEDGLWVQQKVVTLYGNDAGTDIGSDFTSFDQPTVPRDPIAMFDDYPALIGEEIVPFGTFTFERLD